MTGVVRVLLLLYWSSLHCYYPSMYSVYMVGGYVPFKDYVNTRGEKGTLKADDAYSGRVPREDSNT